MKLLLKLELAWHLKTLPAFCRQKTIRKLKPVERLHGIFFGDKAFYFLQAPRYPKCGPVGRRTFYRMQVVRYSDVIHCGNRGDGCIEIITRRYIVHYLGVNNPVRMVFLLKKSMHREKE